MRALDLVLRVLGLAAVWVVVSEGRSEFWYYGVASVAVAVLVSVAVLPLRPLRLPGAGRVAGTLELVGWMATHAFLGAFDVARRALGPRSLVEPVEVRVKLRLRRHSAIVVASALANLLPGTLVHRIGEGHVDMHVLSADLGAERNWRRLEARVARAMEPSAERPTGASQHLD